ncbi:hypothetical protein GGX14DRAFT_470395 [Mycena pura]|uniref:Uncharacterized protein n=1 Tax=Mycena pura TaxID=153505 RepID=A0AAD6Y9Q6_9AGAR|nr:hypothetical protein GGX14DRAFT_470395 [Mycena pura]
MLFSPAVYSLLLAAAMAAAVQTSAPNGILKGACADEATARAFEDKCGDEFIAGCVADEDNCPDACMCAFEACGTNRLEGKECFPGNLFTFSPDPKFPLPDPIA